MYEFLNYISSSHLPSAIILPTHLQSDIPFQQNTTLVIVTSMYHGYRFCTLKRKTKPRPSCGLARVVVII